MTFIANWICKKFGHNWLEFPPLEHICTTKHCIRCDKAETVHLSGPWPHTCVELMGVANGIEKKV